MDVFEDGAMLDGGRQLLFKREIENGVVLTTSVAADICCPRAVHVRGQLCQTFHFCSCSLRKVKRKPTDTCELPLKDLKTTSNRHSKLKKTSAQSLKLRFLVLWGFVQFALFVVRTNRARAPWPPGALCSRCSDLKKAEVKGGRGRCGVELMRPCDVPFSLNLSDKGSWGMFLGSWVVQHGFVPRSLGGCDS